MSLLSYSVARTTVPTMPYTLIQQPQPHRRKFVGACAYGALAGGMNPYTLKNVDWQATRRAFSLLCKPSSTHFEFPTFNCGQLTQILRPSGTGRPNVWPKTGSPGGACQASKVRISSFLPCRPRPLKTALCQLHTRMSRRRAWSPLCLNCWRDGFCTIL